MVICFELFCSEGQVTPVMAQAIIICTYVFPHPILNREFTKIYSFMGNIFPCIVPLKN